eukprot:CAMPEP_0201285632 /NCGR_PEP_ID=MMETSP1317-20130820/113602_1 /ASSEMBLY_ACC=CAM_ASM_000770 /TAXON_ID=187299 /ORGANISM="Undescribed Undescribed, Strain Undescribed" /LENGTH=67 /DNA_ID=CAMNT_0047611289 /DNA_START=1353 /DNA_END=1556 /DNA_ORIENTATION=+
MIEEANVTRYTLNLWVAECIESESPIKGMKIGQAWQINNEGMIESLRANKDGKVIIGRPSSVVNESG